MKFLEIIFNNKRISGSEKKSKKDYERYLELSNIVKEARSKKNLTQEDLSTISKIPLSIIIAIENNKKELIPEYPFIRSILIKLEECLVIRKSKLVNLIKDEKTFKNPKVKFSYLTNKFDLISSWQGNFIYIAILFLSLLVLNSYYINSRTIEFRFIEKNVEE
ncbi:MAG: transcriptional regulator [Prochlorococcus sp. SP3034]|nr:transcriptional regulator [Prochlorococcus sp. SP3034]|tara:strand:- start:514 stop:1002 length:489 start_codon:yes stop_codon:yes gene_type:complete